MSWSKDHCHFHPPAEDRVQEKEPDVKKKRVRKRFVTVNQVSTMNLKHLQTVEQMILQSVLLLV